MFVTIIVSVAEWILSLYVCVKINYGMKEYCYQCTVSMDLSLKKYRHCEQEICRVEPKRVFDNVFVYTNNVHLKKKTYYLRTR